jgi:hypothetical protein
MSRFSRRQVHLVTEAPKPRSEDIGYRQRRYLIMMGIRVACFLVAILMVTQGAGWFAAIPAAGAVIIPYFAVVFANGGREPTDTRGFREYRPNLPAHGDDSARAARPHVRYPGIAGARGDHSRPGPGRPPAAPAGTAQQANRKQPASG